MNELKNASTDFNRVRDGRTAPDFYFDIDLSIVRDEFINIAGNSFYCDANPNDGNFVVYFQETDSLRGPTPFYASPGFIARIPFTQIRIVNSSPQPGKKARIVYGTDTDFQPGSVAQVTLAGVVSVNDIVNTSCQHISDTITLGVIGNTLNTILPPASNINGLNIRGCGVHVTTNAGGSSIGYIFAAPANPVNYTTSGANRILLALGASANGSSAQVANYAISRRIPAGWGLYHGNNTTVASGTSIGNVEFELI